MLVKIVVTKRRGPVKAYFAKYSKDPYMDPYGNGPLRESNCPNFHALKTHVYDCYFCFALVQLLVGRR